MNDKKKKNKRLPFTGALTLMAPIVLIYFFSTSPQHTFFHENEAELVVSFKKTTERVHLCDEEELAEFKAEAKSKRKHMRRAARVCGSRERFPLELAVWIDGKKHMGNRYTPPGLRSDGPVFVYERFTIDRGAHDVKISVRDYREGSEEGRSRPAETLELSKDMEFGGRQRIVVDYDVEEGRLYIREGKAYRLT